jgi:hypothetical protein
MYLNLSPDVEIKVIGGGYPQVWSFTGMAARLIMSIRNRMPIPEDAVFDHFISSGKSKKTDLMSSPLGDGFLISDRLKTLIEKHNYGDIRFYPAVILHRKRLLDNYWCMLNSRTLFQLIDLSKMKFVYRTKRGDDHEIDVQTYQDYMEQHLKVPGNWRRSPITLKDSVRQTLDILSLTPIFPDWLISERLADAIRAAKLTGIRFLPPVNKYLGPLITE